MGLNSWYGLGIVSGDWAQPELQSAVDPFLVALGEGDQGALSAAYREHHTSVRAFASRLLGDEHAAEDLVQETFLSLPRAVRRFRGQSSFRSFVIAVAVNHAKHFVRAAARRRKHLARLATEPRVEAGEPDQRLGREQLGDALFCALDELSIAQRVAFVLCVIEERTSQEVGEILTIPPATVRARVQAAKRELRSSLERGGFR